MRIISLVLLLILQVGGARGQTEAQGSAINSQLLSGLKFRGIGPAVRSGRIADVVKDPTNTSTWYVAVASGGVWKTTSNGTTWEPIFDDYNTYTTGALAIDRSNPSVVWLGTGENASQRSAGYGDGVYKTLDGGKSWTRMGLEHSEHIGKILIDPRNSDVVYVAAQGPLWAPGGDRGLYKTSDGGHSWTRVLEISENTGVTDIAFDPRDPDTLYAAAYQRRRHVGILVAGGPESTIYKTTDGGTSWRTIERGLPGGDKGRIALAVSPQFPDIVYALVAAERDQSGFFRSNDRGESWEKKSDYIVADPQYYGEIYADPHRFDRVYAMDVIVHVTDDGGHSFRPLNTRGKHVDNHSLLFDPGDPDYLLMGCDGGLYESWDQGDTWRFIDNLSITQFYRVGLDDALPFYNVYGGTQDNATLGGPSRTTNIHGIRNSDWFVTVGGDGFQTRVEPGNPDILYSQYQYAGIVRYDRRTGERLDIQPQPEPGEPALRWHWDSPLLISPHSPTRVYFAAQRLFRSDDRANTWRPVSPDLSRGEDRNLRPVMGRVWGPDAVWKNVFTSPYGTIVALDESPLVENLLYVGTDDGLVQVSVDGGQNWSRFESFPGVPEKSYVADLAASRHERDRVFAVFNNHKEGDFKPYVLRSDDRGRSWTDITSDLPDGHITWTLVEDHVDPDLLFVGTEFGLFASITGGRSWIRLRGGLPTVAVRDLEIQRRENDLVAATFGRGFYILDDYSPLRHLSQETLDEAGLVFPVRDAPVYIPSNPMGGGPRASQGNGFFVAPNPPFGATFTYYLKTTLETRAQRRRAREAEAVRGGTEGEYPSWDDLRAEDRESPPAVLLTVRDREGAVVQRVSGPTRRGIHRVTWDLRLPNRPGPPAPLSIPGTYSVALSTMIDGRETTLGPPQTFSTIPINQGVLRAEDMQARLDFEKEVSRLQRAIGAADTALHDSLRDITRLRQASQASPSDNASLLERLARIEQRLQAVEERIEGDETRRSRAEFVAPGIQDRINTVVRTMWASTSPPTTTHRRAYEIAAQEFEGILGELRDVLDAGFQDIERMAEQAGIPWTRAGRLPNWRR